MRVAVTGATGNVGIGVLDALARDEAVESIIGIARRAPLTQRAKTTWRAADVRTADLAAEFAGADAVVHLAWMIQPERDRDQLQSINVGGSRRMLEGVAAAGVRTVVVASSVGAYSRGPKDAFVDEDWPTAGVRSSLYARQKVEVERMLDAFESTHPDVRIVRLRPALIFKRAAASEIRRLFIGPLVPRRMLGPGSIPLVPKAPHLLFQVVHCDDVAEAARLAIHGEARGAFNLAARPVVDASVLGEILGARPVAVPDGLLRGAAALTWRLRLQPTSPGWVDLALGVPLMDASRAHSLLGWSSRYRSPDIVRELLEGMRDGAGDRTPPLQSPCPGGLTALRRRVGTLW